MKKLSVLVLAVSLMSGCTAAKLNIYLGESSKTIYDLSITRVTKEREAIIVSQANDRYLILTPALCYSASESQITSSLNNSCILQAKEIPDLITVLKSILAAYDQSMDRSASRVISYSAYLELGSIVAKPAGNGVISGHDVWVNLDLEYVRGAKALIGSNGYTRMNIAGHEMRPSKKEVSRLLDDVTAAYASMQSAAK